ncbi:MAG TPA: O-methyltransferase [Acidimicrobiales bacterium]|nr:O-methyltransferase [Acidimicrobiales bacterium]
MAPRSFLLTDELHAYLLAHMAPLDEVAQSLIDATVALGGVSGMQIAPDQGAFLALLVKLTGARRCIEVGTFTGYSALCVARALPGDGTLLCCDVSDEWTRIGREHWARAGVDHKIDLRIAPAVDTLRALPRDEQFDFAFVDADKPNYVNYIEEIVPRLRSNGVLLVDNVLWGGAVIDASNTDDNTVAIRRTNDFVAAHPNLESVILPVADGLTIARKR